ncbi:hypothetical protein C7M84_016111 [Penaeus vannamei]|uniref:Uncharacterized protein n=1 Tax=Penaeus vannamei TaxID=6689 RepID=A0A423SP02_PENVA|nr:hypothetical protein C7M84_016111 [Penaeus vannamei]
MYSSIAHFSFFPLSPLFSRLSSNRVPLTFPTEPPCPLSNSFLFALASLPPLNHHLIRSIFSYYSISLSSFSPFTIYVFFSSGFSFFSRSIPSPPLLISLLILSLPFSSPSTLSSLSAFPSIPSPFSPSLLILSLPLYSPSTISSFPFPLFFPLLSLSPPPFSLHTSSLPSPYHPFVFPFPFLSLVLPLPQLHSFLLPYHFFHGLSPLSLLPLLTFPIFSPSFSSFPHLLPFPPALPLPPFLLSFQLSLPSLRTPSSSPILPPSLLLSLFLFQSTPSYPSCFSIPPFLFLPPPPLFLFQSTPRPLLPFSIPPISFFFNPLPLPPPPSSFLPPPPSPFFPSSALPPPISPSPNGFRGERSGLDIPRITVLRRRQRSAKESR